MRQQKAYTPHLARYGYGWVIGVADGKKVVQHGDGILGFVSNILRIPEDEISIVLLSNVQDYQYLPKMTMDFYGVLSGKHVELPTARAAVAGNPALILAVYTFTKISSAAGTRRSASTIT